MSSVVNPAVLQAPPYNFSSGTNGLINIPSLIGNLFGGFLGGWSTDWVADKWSIRNKGIFHPEARLSMITIPLILTTIGMALFGAGLEEQWSWPGLFVSFGLISVTLTATSSISMTYILDAYYPAAAEALLLVNALKNIIAFGFIYAVSPWVSKVGFKAVSSPYLIRRRIVSNQSVAPYRL
jgi:MFS family permease